MTKNRLKAIRVQAEAQRDELHYLANILPETEEESARDMFRDAAMKVDDAISYLTDAINA